VRDFASTEGDCMVRPIEKMSDDGETAEELGSAMAIAFRAMLHEPV
jgi:hypothetical protein